MTLYTSDTNGINATKTTNTTAKYLIASVLILICSLVYEHFSHGVYSMFMLGTFLVPLIGGALPGLVSELISGKKRTGESDRSVVALLQLASVATLTAGSFMQGVLEIYGTTNKLMMLYPMIGITMAIAAICISIKEMHVSYLKDLRSKQNS